MDKKQLKEAFEQRGIRRVKVGGFDIDGFTTYLWATIIAWAVNLALDVLPGRFRGTRR